MGIFDFLFRKKAATQTHLPLNDDSSTDSKDFVKLKSIADSYVQASVEEVPNESLSPEEKAKRDLDALNAFQNRISNAKTVEEVKVDETPLSPADINAKMAEEYIKIENPFRGE